MGSFIGHFAPGVFFLLFGLRWTFALWHRYLSERRSSRRRAHDVPICTPTFPCRTCPGVPVEGLIKMVFCSIGFVGEFVTALENGQFKHIGNSQHMAMFFFFAVNGFVDVLVHYNVHLPRDTEYATMAFALFVEGLLFVFHLHGRPPLDVQVHQLLIVTIVACLVAVAVEWAHRENILSIMFRTYGILLQGTWFIHVGFILYNPLPGAIPWAEHDHDQLMMVTTMFCGHLAVLLFFMAGAGLVVHQCTRTATLSMDFEKVSYKELGQELPVE